LILTRSSLIFPTPTIRNNGHADTGDEQARQLDRRIHRNYLDRRWLYEVITERANIELMLNDPYWARFDFTSDYPFAVLVLNVTTLTRGFHPGEFSSVHDDP
jgi:hypothetical protein